MIRPLSAVERAVLVWVLALVALALVGLAVVFFTTSRGRPSLLYRHLLGGDGRPCAGYEENLTVVSRNIVAGRLRQVPHRPILRKQRRRMAGAG